MRFYEFANAEDQLSLLRVIIDNTWTAIAQQAAQEKQAEAERMAKAELKPRAKRARKGANISVPPPPPPPTKPEAPLANQPPSPHNKPNLHALNTVNRLPSNNPQLQQPTTDAASNPKLASTLQHEPIATTPIKPQNSLKTGYLGKNTGATEKENGGDERDGVNGITTLKR
jgi:hypothetical protein